MKAMYQKEIKSYFNTTTGWLFLLVFLSLGSLVFYLNNLMQRSSEFTPFFSMMSYVWMLLCPLLVMRLLAGERRQMTDKLLLSAPVSDWAIVGAKYLAACTVLLLSITASLVYPLLLAMYAKIYPMELLTAYLGFVLQGCAFIALDMLVTSAAKNTAAAAALAFGTNLFVWLISLLANAPQTPSFLAAPIAFFSLYERFVPYISAQFSPANTLFYLLFCVCMLVLTTVSFSLQRLRRS